MDVTLPCQNGAMSQAALFEADRTFGVGEIAARVARAVVAAFPAEIWVKGEVDGWRPPGATGHAYFNLCERNSRRGPTLSLIHISEPTRPY